MSTQDKEAEVRKTVHSFFQAWMQEDSGTMDRVLGFIAGDFTGLGTGPGDYYPDLEAVRELFLREKEQMPYPSTLEMPWMNVRLLRPTLGLVEGQIRSEIYMEDQTHVVQPRYSFVLEHREDRWLFVHFHFSMPDAMQDEGDTLMDALEGRNRELEREVAQRTAELNQALADLKAAQARLVQQEKMASLGQLTAGIAHEIKNPLNFVNNFAEMVGELVDELDAEVGATHNTSGSENTHHFKEILADLKSNAERIVVHGKRADGIVRSMLEHARATSTERRAIDLNALVTEYVDRALHGRRGQSPTHASIRARIPEFNIEIAKDLDESVGEIRVAPQEIGRVLLNLLSNAFDAVSEHDQPVVRVQTRRAADAIEIRVADNGPGIPVNLRQKIYEPFFTTKPTGSGTGLGLSLSYDIITQGYGGTLSVECEEGEATTFIVTLPVNQTKAGTSS